MNANNGKGNNGKDNNTRGIDPFLWTDPEREQIKSYSTREEEKTQLPREEKAPDIKDKVKIKPTLL